MITDVQQVCKTCNDAIAINFMAYDYVPIEIEEHIWHVVLAISSFLNCGDTGSTVSIRSIDKILELLKEYRGVDYNNG